MNVEDNFVTRCHFQQQMSGDYFHFGEVELGVDTRILSPR